MQVTQPFLSPDNTVLSYLLSDISLTLFAAGFNCPLPAFRFCKLLSHCSQILFPLDFHFLISQNKAAPDVYFYLVLFHMCSSLPSPSLLVCHSASSLTHFHPLMFLLCTQFNAISSPLLLSCSIAHSHLFLLTLKPFGYH